MRENLINPKRILTVKARRLKRVINDEPLSREVSPWSAPPCRRFGLIVNTSTVVSCMNRNEAAPGRRGPKRRQGGALQGGVSGAAGI